MPGDETDWATDERAEGDPVDTARRAIHDLFVQGYIDEHHATAALLAIDLGRHRVERAGWGQAPAERAEAARGASWPGAPAPSGPRSDDVASDRAG